MASKAHWLPLGSKRGKNPDTTRVGDVGPKEEIVVTIALAGPNAAEYGRPGWREITEFLGGV